MANNNAARSLADVIQQLEHERLFEVDSREWREDWRESWVVFADLVAFAERNLISRDIVLNNIVRFDRASAWARTACDVDRVYRFSDSTFALTKTLGVALQFAIALQHACLAMSTEVLESNSRFFSHTIAPRVTIAHGHVLWLPTKLPPKRRFLGIDSSTLIAGDAIVHAYKLEKASAGGLITLKRSDFAAMTTNPVRGSKDRAKSGLERFVRGKTAEFFVRGDVVDFPWLLLRPVQRSRDEFWAADKDSVDHAIAAFLNVWELSAAEYYSSNGANLPLATTKHADAAIRHGIQSIYLTRGHRRPTYYSLAEARQSLQQD